MVSGVQTPSQCSDRGRSPEKRTYKPLRIKYFHWVSAGNQHPYVLKSRYGKVRLILILFLSIRPINFPFPELQAARRVMPLTLAVAGYPLVTLTGRSADAGLRRQRHSG